MKKIVLMLLVAMFPFLTTAQKRSEKSKQVNTEQLKRNMPGPFAKAVKFNFHKETKNITEIIIGKILCNDGDNVCAELIEITDKKNIIFTTKNKAFSSKDPKTKGLNVQEVHGNIFLGDNNYKAELSFLIQESNKGNKSKFEGRLVFNGSFLKNKKDKVILFLSGEM
jgi:hypothetical protein